MTIKRNLFLWNQHKVRSNRGVSSDDKFTQVFGSIIPRQIPESSAWWKVVFSFAFVLDVSHSATCARRRAETSKQFATMVSKESALVLRRPCLELHTCVCCDAIEPRARFSIRSIDVSLPFCLPFCVCDISSMRVLSCCHFLPTLLVHA